MSRNRAMLIAVVLAMVLGGSGTSAWADRGFSRGPSHYGHHHRGGYGIGWVPGLVLGSALVWAATRPTVVYAEAPPPVVVVPQRLPAPPAGGDWWYYCRPAGAYYPYVQSCPIPWERVPATVQ